MKCIIVTLALMIFGGSLIAQPDSIVAHYLQQVDFLGQEKVLFEKYGSNKLLPTAYRLECLIALSHYPELVDVKIEFKEKKMTANAMARPKMNFLFKKRNKRTYQIFLNDNQDLNKGVVLQDNSFNAKVGIIGHELAHILDYEQKSRWRLIANGVGYLFPRFVTRFEKATDKRAVEYGFGYSLYDRLYYQLYEAEYSEKLRAKIVKNRRHYLSLEEILAEIEQLN